MNLTRWQGPVLSVWPDLGQLSTLQQEIDRLFDAPLTGLVRAPSFLNGWTPALDLHEDKDQFVVKAELPGVKKENIEVSVQDGTLSISGERKSEEKFKDAGAHRTERFFGRFQRTVSLPGAVAQDKVKAEYKDGVLTITLPKTEEAKPKQIDVKVN